MTESVARARFDHEDLTGEPVEQLLRRVADVRAAPDCGWSDLGTPQRVADAVCELKQTGRPTPRAAPERS